MSTVTKRILSASLQSLLLQKPLDKITVQDLVNDAQVSRKTFYYHFRDIYDLLEWSLVEEGRRLLETDSTQGSWQQRISRVFDYFTHNRTMILNIYRSLEKESLLLSQHISRLVLPLLEQDFDAQPDHERVAPEDRRFLLDLYSYGLVQLFLHWIGDGMKPDADYMMRRIDRLFSDSMSWFIRRCLESEEP